MEQKNINSSNQIITLKDIASINPTSVLPDTFHYIDLESVKDGKFYNKKQKISKEEAPSRAQRVVVENDILFQTVRPYQKNHLFVSNQLNGEVASSGFTHIRVDANKASARYIFQLLHSSIFNQKVNLLCTGTSYPAITSISLASIPFRLPSLPEQEKIAEFLSALDDRITLQESKIELLTQQKKGYAQRIFSRELRFRDDNGNKYPEWEEKPLGQVVEIVMGQSPLSENYTDDNKHTVLIQGNADMKQGKIVPRVYSKDGSKKANPGDIILSVRAPVGPVSKTDIEAFIGRGVCSIKGSDYIFNFLKYFYEIKGWDSLAQGSTFTAVNSAQVKNLIIPLPSSAEQGKIANFLSTLDDQIILEKEKLTQLKLQKQGYMQRIFG